MMIGTIAYRQWEWTERLAKTLAPFGVTTLTDLLIRYRVIWRHDNPGYLEVHERVVVD